jgi:hypothetical protein
MSIEDDALVSDFGMIDEAVEAIRNPQPPPDGYTWLPIPAFCAKWQMTERALYRAMRDRRLNFPTHTGTGEILIGIPHPKPEAPRQPHRPRWQGVYFIESGGFIKIGLASDVYQRVHAIRQSIPFDITPLAFIWADCSKAAWEVEQLWHAAFAEIRVRGEWFTDTPELRQAIVDYAKPWEPRKKAA